MISIRLTLVLSAILVVGYPAVYAITPAEIPALEAQTPQEVIKRLINANEYSVALARAKTEVQNDFTIENIELLLSVNQEVSEKMLRRFRKRDLTVFDYDHMTDKKAEGLKIEQPKEEEVLANIKIFSAQRDTLEFVIAGLDKMLEASANERHLKLKRDAEQELNKVANFRTQYISYNVISPYLCEAYRTAYIARGFWNDDEEKLLEAAKLVAKGCHHDWIYESTEKTQKQFITVVAYIKHNMSADEWEQAKAYTTLTPSLDPSKMRGPRHWLNNKNN